MYFLKSLVSVGFPILVLASSNKDEDKDWANDTSFTLIPNTTFRPTTSGSVLSQSTTVRVDASTSNVQDQETHTTTPLSDADIPGIDEILPLVLKMLLKERIKDELKVDENSQKMKTPSTFLTPPGPIQTPAADNNSSSESSEESDEKVSSTPNPSLKLHPASNIFTKMENTEQNSNSESEEVSASTTSPPIITVHPDLKDSVKTYADYYQNYQPVRNSEPESSEEFEINPHQKIYSNKPTKVEDKEEENLSNQTPNVSMNESEDIITPAPMIETVPNEQSTENELSPIQMTTESSVIQNTGDYSNGMDKVIYENPENKPTNSLDINQRQPQFYFFLRPRPTPVPMQYQYQPMMQIMPETFETENNPSMMTRILPPLRPYSVKTDPWKKYLDSTYSNSPIASDSLMYSNPTLQQQQQSVQYPMSERGYWYNQNQDNAMQMSNQLPIMPQIRNKHYYMNLQRPASSMYHSSYSYPGLGFNGDYFRSPYWTNPYPINPIHYQRNPYMPMQQYGNYAF